MTGTERSLGNNKYVKTPGKIGTFLPSELFIDDKDFFQIAADGIGIEINVRNIGSVKAGAPQYIIEFPQGEQHAVLAKVYELAGGKDKFHAIFKQDPVQKRKQVSEPLPSCSVGRQANSHPVWEWVKGYLGPFVPRG